MFIDMGDTDYPSVSQKVELLTLTPPTWEAVSRMVTFHRDVYIV